LAKIQLLALIVVQRRLYNSVKQPAAMSRLSPTSEPAPFAAVAPRLAREPYME